jgi:hypothetical protein
MNRDRSYRRAQRDRYKAKSLRDFRNVTGHEPNTVSATRHALDCGRPGCTCKGDRYGKRDRIAAKRELATA